MKFLASSKDPTPPKDPNEDGNFIIENFTYTHEPSNLIFPAILNLVEKPTLKHAKQMLKIYNIHLPLSTILPKRPRQVKAKSPPASASASKGGMPPAAIQHELLVLDTMHDLLDTDPLAMFDIFKREFDIPKALKDSFLRSDYSFTRDCASYIQQKARLVIQDTYFDNQSKKAYDFALAQSISNWKNFTFVLDNFAASLQNGGGGPQSQGVMMLLGCAYLIVLLANMKRLNMIGVTNIHFVDGFFMKLDGSYVSRFLTLFTKTIKRLTNLDTHVVAQTVFFGKITRPKYFNKLFPHAQALVNKTQIMMQNQTFDIFPQNAQPNQIYFPHSKEQFFQHIKANKTNKTLWYLNFLRDAFKADVALETDSVFVTHDRIAFIYYKLIGGKQGFLISVNVSQASRPSPHDVCKYIVAF